MINMIQEISSIAQNNPDGPYYVYPLPRGRMEVWTSSPAKVLGANSFLYLHQIHSTILVKSADLLKAQAAGMDAPSADGIYGSPQTPECWVIKTADCMPIAFIGEKACAFVHAGRRGLWDNILLSPVIKELKPKFIFIGPHIKKCCYEVELALLKEAKNFEGKVFYQEITPAMDCCSPVLGGLPSPKILLDLTQTATAQLMEHYPAAQILLAKPCTCCAKNLHSYRREQNKERNFNLWRF